MNAANVAGGSRSGATVARERRDLGTAAGSVRTGLGSTILQVIIGGGIVFGVGVWLGRIGAAGFTHERGRR